MEGELTLIADAHDHGALDRVTFFSEGHGPGDPLKLLNAGHGIPHALAVGFDVASELAAFLNRLTDDIQRIPGERSDIIRDLTVPAIVFIDELLGCTNGALCGVVRAEEQAVAVRTTQFYGLSRTPAVTPHDVVFDCGVKRNSAQESLILVS